LSGIVVLGLELLDVYGMSENFAYSHACKPKEVRVGYVGSVNPGVEHRIADNGEIQVKSPAQMIRLLQNARQNGRRNDR
jgi:long-chain acyl-CoA synthetase